MRLASYDLATATLELGPLTANARGGKNASITINGKPLKFQLKNCSTPWGYQGYGGGDRRSLDVRADAELQAFATALDAKVLAEGAKRGRTEGGCKPHAQGKQERHLRAHVSAEDYNL